MSDYGANVFVVAQEVAIKKNKQKEDEFNNWKHGLWWSSFLIPPASICTVQWNFNFRYKLMTVCSQVDSRK